MGHPGRSVRRLAVGDRQRHRQRRPAHHRAGTGDLVGRLDLDRQRLPAGHHDLAAVVFGIGRRGGLPQSLYRRPDALHRGLGGLRPFDITPDAGAGARDAGVRRRGRHIGQHHAYPHHLPQGATGTRHGHQRHGRRRVVGRRAYAGCGHPLRRRVAVALRREHPHRAGGAVAEPPLPAGQSRAGERTPFRLARRRNERPDLRLADGFGRRVFARA